MYIREAAAAQLQWRAPGERGGTLAQETGTSARADYRSWLLIRGADYRSGLKSAGELSWSVAREAMFRDVRDGGSGEPKAFYENIV